MELTTSNQYKALNEASYNSLAAYASTIPATVTLHPGFLTIVISEDAAKEVGEFIDDNGLDFRISQIEVDDDNLRDVIDSETTDADTLRKIIYQLLEEKRAMAETHKSVLDDIAKQCDSAKENRDMYQKWYYETKQGADRVKSQVKAIAVLVNSIFPED
ncbi:MAG: hypothetical protein J6B13_09770 [Muribaculaceae bacterium]|nr:hypothetical protein [Muribaculaceae bacterium]